MVPEYLNIVLLIRRLVYELSNSVLKNKNFLITQSSLRLIAGSEINTLELAEYLQSQGAKVTVYTYFLSEPISLYFKAKNIKVVTDDLQLKIENFDYVWVHHQVVPMSFVDKIAKGGKEVLPIFIFLHMSGLKTHFLEQAHIWSLEEKIASKILYVSDEARDNIITNSFDTSGHDEGFYRNPAPVSFSDIKHSHQEEVKSVLIVSNHPAKEVYDAAIILREKGIHTVITGEGQQEYKLIDPEYINSFDVVVSIGKTVQYCLVSNIPVYIYDVWGGPGYLSEMNEVSAAKYNLSGRGFDKKDALAIVREITDSYSEAVKYQSGNHQRFINEFSMDSVLPEIIKSLKPRKVDAFDTYYTQYVTGALMMLKYKFYHENLLVKREEEIDSLNKNFGEKYIEFETVLEYKDKSIKQVSEAISAIEESQAYRLSLVIAKPVRFIKRLGKKRK